VRVTTAFNKMLAIPGASVSSVSFTPEGIESAAPAGGQAPMPLWVQDLGALRPLGAALASWEVLRCATE
jgi:hypothetical protein